MKLNLKQLPLIVIILQTNRNTNTDNQDTLYGALQLGVPMIKKLAFWCDIPPAVFTKRLLSELLTVMGR